MISPAIRPRRAFNPITKGLFTAARNSVNKVQESTQKISTGLSKDQKFAMNYVEFFGSKKTTKILRKNLKSITKSLKTTFDIAKNLKSEVGKMAKGGGLLKGVVGTIGAGLFGGVLGKGLLIVLAGLALGGIGFLLYRNAGSFFEFLRNKIDDLRPIVNRILGDYFQDIFTQPGATDLQETIDTNVSDLTQANVDSGMSVEEARANAIAQQKISIAEDIQALKEKKKELNLGIFRGAFFSQEKKQRLLEIEQAIKNLEYSQKYLESGTGAFTVPGLPSTFNFGSPVSSQGYEELTDENKIKRLESQIVGMSPSQLSDFKFNLLRSSQQPFGTENIRMTADLINLIRSKQNEDFNFELLNRNLKEGDLKKIDELMQSDFKNLLKLATQEEEKIKVKELKKDGVSSINIIKDTSNNSKKQNVNNQQLVSQGADGNGMIDIKFLSALDYDSLSLSNSKNLYNIYMVG